ncbi:MAG: hypothetical protein QOH29_2835, partial [Actinomycetota bacterium]|nr:hypothetical protein [Actinomycetota bacterium]
MENAGDYFVALQPEQATAIGEPANASAGEPKRHRGRVLVVVAAVVAAGLVAVGLTAHGAGGHRRPVDTRPIALPESMGGLALGIDAISQQHTER